MTAPTIDENPEPGESGYYSWHESVAKHHNDKAGVGAHHAASRVSVTASGLAVVSATDVQGALADLDSGKVTAPGSPATGDALVWDGSQWAADSGTYAQAQTDFLIPLSGVGSEVKNHDVTDRITASLVVPLVTATWRYVVFKVATSSGNIDVGVVEVTDPGDYTGDIGVSHVVSTGVIACPAASNAVQIDLGSFELTAKTHYMIGIWADNTTVQYGAASSSNTAPRLGGRGVGGDTSFQAATSSDLAHPNTGFGAMLRP